MITSLGKGEPITVLLISSLQNYVNVLVCKWCIPELELKFFLIFLNLLFSENFIGN